MSTRYDSIKKKIQEQNAYKINAYHWTSEELYDLGSLLRNIGQTICSAGGRLKLAVERQDREIDTIKIESLSTLNDAVGGVCSLGWEIRNAVNEQLSADGSNTPQTQKSLEELKLDLKNLSAMAASINDPFARGTIEASMDDLEERIAKAEKTVKPDAEDSWNVELERDNPASLPETCHLEAVAHAAGQIFRNSGVDEVQAAVMDFGSHGYFHLYQILNMDRASARRMTTKRNFDVFEEVLSLFGYKWRTDGESTRFDLPIGRFSFAQSAFRKRSERRAATFFRNEKEIKRNTSTNIYDAINRVMDRAMDAVNEAAKIDDSQPGDFSVRTVEAWMKDVNIILKAFKGIIPHRLWHFRTWERDGQAGGFEPVGMANSVSDLVKDLLDRVYQFTDGQVQPDKLSINISNSLFLSSSNRYLSDEARERMDIVSPEEPLLFHQLIFLIASCIWEWTTCVEENELFIYEERVVKEKEPGPVSASVSIGKLVYDPELVEKGKLPMAWDSECSDWGQEILRPISFWDRIKHRR